MRLSHPLLSSPLHWQEGRVPVLVAEKPEIFRQLVFSLSAQAQGEEGDFVLSLDYETLDCADHLHVMRDYVYMVLDDRKLQNRFQSRLQWTVREELASPTDALQQQIGQYLQLVVGAMEYPVSFSEGEYVLPLLKALKCQPVLDGVHPLERLMQYIELYSGLMKCPRLFFQRGTAAAVSDGRVSEMATSFAGAAAGRTAACRGHLPAGRLPVRTAA